MPPDATSFSPVSQREKLLFMDGMTGLVIGMASRDALTSMVPNIRTMELEVKTEYNDCMKPLVHPALDDVTVEGILHALSDPVRVAIFARIAASDCAQTCSDFLTVRERNVPKSTLSQHFKALREAGLIRSERCGVEMHNTSRCPEIETRFPGLIAAIVKAHYIQTATLRKAPRPRKRSSGSVLPASRNGR
jgi:DNA-binding transcriptional ArsR family regulator